MTAFEIVRGDTPAAKAELYRLGLCEMEAHRDDLIAACRALRRMMNQQLKLAGLPVDEADEPAPAADAVDPHASSTGNPTPRVEEPSSYSSSSENPDGPQ